MPYSNQEDSKKSPFSLEGRKGFNQYRWDLVVKRVDSPEPYFTRYLEFAPPGKYEIQIVGKGVDLTTEITIIRPASLN